MEGAVVGFVGKLRRSDMGVNWGCAVVGLVWVGIDSRGMNQ